MTRGFSFCRPANWGYLNSMDADETRARFGLGFRAQAGNSLSQKAYDYRGSEIKKRADERSYESEQLRCLSDMANLRTVTLAQRFWRMLDG